MPSSDDFDFDPVAAARVAAARKKASSTASKQTNGLPAIPDGYQLEGPWKDYQNSPPIPDGFQPEEYQKNQTKGLRFDDLPKGPLMFDDIKDEGPPQGQRRGNVFDQFDEPKRPNIFDQFDNVPSDNAPVTAAGSAKAIGAGAATGIAGIPGDLIRLGNLLRRVDPLNLPGMVHQQVPVPDALNKVQQSADNLYQPQNSVESDLKTGASVVAPAVITGPEGLAGKGLLGAARVMAKRAVTQAAIPTAASSAAGAATQGTEYEPYARLGAALLAGGLAAKGGNPEPITSDAIKAAADKNFTDFRSAPVSVKPDVVENAAQRIQSDLAASGLSKAHANDMVGHYIGNTNPVTLDQLQETRSLLGKAAKADTPDGVAAIRAKSAIDGLMNGLKPSDTVSGASALPDALASLNAGRANSAVSRQLESIENAGYRSDMNAAASGAGDNADNALRQQINSLLKSRQAMNRLAPFKSEMERVVQGTVTQNLARKLSKLTGGDNPWHSGPYWLASLLLEPYSGSLSAMAAAAPFAGMAARKIAANIGARNYNALKSNIAARAQGVPLPQPINPWPTRSLIGTLAAQQGNTGQ